jgi:hypothetical protein
MVVEHYGGVGGPTGTISLVDVLDRVLDKGIVIDAWVRVSLVGIDLLSVEARVVVASIDTYLRYAEAIGLNSPTSRGIVAGPEHRPLPAASEGAPTINPQRARAGVRRQTEE